MQTPGAEPRVALDRRGRVLVVSMRREAKRNAIDAQMTAALDAALNAFEDDGDLWVAVLTGTPRVFSAGTDLRGGAGDPTPRGGEYGIVRRRSAKPIIAAVEGMALGGGFEIVLACDLVVAARDAVFGLPEVARGVIATCGALFRGPRALPLNVAREMLFTGQPLDAARLQTLGFVNRVTEPGGALDGALALAEEICRNSPVSVRLSKEALERTVAAEDGAGWEATGDALALLSRSEDLKEGIAAFFERRAPNWRGR